MNEKELFLKKFEEKLSTNLDKNVIQDLKSADFELTQERSQDYDTFRKENLPNSFSFYEKFCNTFEKLLPIEPDKKSKESIQKHIENAHLNVSVQGVMS